MMRYHANAEAMDLEALQVRLTSADLIPSQEPLLDDLASNMAALDKAGIHSMADLISALKTKKSLAALSETSGVGEPYLQLLRLTINGFFPKPRPLKEIDWIDADAIDRLARVGIRNTQQLFETSSDDRAGLAKETGIDPGTFDELLTIAGLCRIQWVAPSFARVLVAAGYRDAAAIAEADPEMLTCQIEEANAGARFYKSKVGLRDVGRLVAASRYVA